MLRELFSSSLAAFSIAPADRIVVAVSGGPDSVCLLHLFRTWISRSDDLLRVSGLDRLHVAHLNHGFRPEADEEAAFVAELCRSWGIACTVEKRPVAQFCRDQRLSKQEGARFVRYAFLEEVAERIGARWIAIGHTADDGVETFLMHLIRGAGGEGLGGIPSIREGRIIRPMLQITRDLILQELTAHAIPYREDPSNSDRRFFRSRVRHDLIPLLSDMNPNIKATLLRAATLLDTEQEFFDAQIAALVPQIFRLTQNEVVCDLALFSSLHKALQRRLIRWGIAHLQGSTRGIGFHHIETILTCGIGTISLPHALLAQKQGNTLRLSRTRLSPTTSPADFDLPLLFQVGAGETVEIPSWKIRLTWTFQATVQQEGADVAYFDYDKISGPLTIRSWRLGDVFTPLGMRGRHKKLQDFFVDRKIPRAMRHQIPLLVDSEGILWIIGYAVDERCRVTETTKTIVRMGIMDPKN